MQLLPRLSAAIAPLAGDNLSSSSLVVSRKLVGSIFAPRRRLVGALAACVLLLAAPLSAQSSGTSSVEGKVLNGVSGAYLGNVRVHVEGTARETITDANGVYRLSGLPAGELVVTASYIGLDAKFEKVTVAPGQGVEVNFELTRRFVRSLEDESKPVVLENYEVVESRELDAQSLALNQQRQSPNIKNVVAYDEHPTSSEDNIGDFMRFIPGLSVIYSGRSAISASVRGMPAETSGITLDGVELSGAFTGNTRAVSLLAVPTANIATMEVTKVPTPDMAAHGLGGSINITTKSGFERAKPLFSYNIHTVIDPEIGFDLDKKYGPHDSVTGRHIRPSFDLTYVLPVNKSLSITANVAQKNTYGESTTAVSGWNLGSGFQSSSNLSYGYQFVTINSARLAVDWKMGDNNVFGVSYSYRERDADQGTPGFTAIHGAGAEGDATFTQGAATGVGSISQVGTIENLENDTGHAMFKYRHLGETWRIDFNASHSKSAFYFRPSDDIGYFGGSSSINIPNLIVRSEGMNGAATNPQELLADSLTITDRLGNPVDFADGGLYTINTLGSVDSSNRVEKNQLRLDLRREFDLAVPFTVQTGMAYSTETQELANRGKSYAFRPGVSVADRQARHYGVVDPGFRTPQVYGQNMQWISKGKLFELFQDRPDYFVLDEALAHRTQVNASKLLDEEITAAYLRVDTRLLRNRLWLVGGVRYERTEDHGEGPLVDPSVQWVRNADGTLARSPTGQLIPRWATALERDQLVYEERGTSQKTSYDGFFPSLNATYNFTDDLLLRFGYARTIGRPNLPFIIPGVTYSNVTATSTTQTITVVNSRLRPWMANNFDLSLESYMFKNGFGSIGVFQKDIKDFFVVTSEQATPELLELYSVFPAAGDTLDYFINTRGNGGDATVKGLEFSYRQNLTFLPDWARGVQVFANYTRSKLGGENAADFTGFNPETLSWGVTLTRPRYAVKFTSTEQDETRRNALATSALNPAGTYQWQGELKRYVLSAEFSLTRNLSLYASLSDFNEPDGLLDVQKVYNPNTPPNLRNQRVATRGQALVLGIKGSF